MEKHSVSVEGWLDEDRLDRRLLIAGMLSIRCEQERTDECMRLAEMGVEAGVEG